MHFFTGNKWKIYSTVNVNVSARRELKSLNSQLWKSELTVAYVDRVKVSW